ncbi:MAG: hypothetical protein QM724_10320 [Flavobacteriales bacterium]
MTTRFLFLAAASFLLAPIQAQRADSTGIRTLFGSEHRMQNGGWGGPTAAYTRIMDHDALLVGLRGGWLIDHRLTIGLAGYGLVTDVPNTAYDAYLIRQGRMPRKTSQFRTGYGGLLIEPIIAHRSAVHVSLPIIIGAGGCAYETWTPLPHDFDPATWSDDAQAFFVIEPGVDLEVNLVRMVRLGIGASYRYTSDITLPGTPKDAMRGFNAALTIKVGRF